MRADKARLIALALLEIKKIAVIAAYLWIFVQVFGSGGLRNISRSY